METPVNIDCQYFSLFKYLKENFKNYSETKVFEMTFHKNEYLYKPPVTDRYVYEVVEGAFKLGSYTEEGAEFTYDVVSKRDFFGNLKYLNNQFFEYSKSLTTTKIRVYELSFFKNIITKEPVVAEWFISYIVKRWCIAENKLRNINERDTTKKIKFLDTFLDKKIVDLEGNSYLLHELLTQKDMGDLIGVTRQTIANTLKKKSLFVM